MFLANTLQNSNFLFSEWAKSKHKKYTIDRLVVNKN